MRNKWAPVEKKEINKIEDAIKYNTLQDTPGVSKLNRDPKDAIGLSMENTILTNN